MRTQMRFLQGGVLSLSLIINVGLYVLVVKQDSLIDRQMELIRSVMERAKTPNAGGGIPTASLEDLCKGWPLTRGQYDQIEAAGIDLDKLCKKPDPVSQGG